MTFRSRSSGFTLIEMVMVIVLLGILAGILAPVITQNITAYTATQARSDLINRGRIALGRLARELHQAVPNSVNVINPTTAEFVTSSVGGLYVDRNETRISNGSCAIAKRFRPGFSLNTLCLLHTNDNAVAPFLSADVLVIANSSVTELRTGITRVALTGVTPASPLWTVTFANHTFPNSSPGMHYSIVDSTHEVGLSGTGINWLVNTGYNATYDNIANNLTSQPLLIDGINAAGANGGVLFDGSQLANGVLIVTLDLIDGNETITVQEEIYVRNTP